MSVVASRLAPRHRARHFAPLDFELEPGISSGIVEDFPAGQELLHLLGGMSLPKRGRLTVFGKEPAHTPTVRAASAVLLPEEPPDFLGSTVQSHLEEIRRLRTEASVQQDPIDGFLDEELLHAPTRRLSATERRRVALFSALRLTSPRLIALFEPEGACSEGQRAILYERLRHWSEQETVVFLLSTNVRHARKLAGRVFDLRAQSSATPSRAGTRMMLRVERPREVAARLLTQPVVVRVTLDPQSSQHLVVEGNDDERLAKAITEAVVAEQCELFEMTQVKNSTRAA